MDISDLKGLELPVKIRHIIGHKITTITAYNSNNALIVDSDGIEGSMHLDWLGHYELAPKTKTVVYEKEFDIIDISGRVIDTTHIKRTYEICEETNNIIDMKEG